MKNYKGIEEFYKSYIQLEQLKRTGWVMLNVPAKRLESVADHTLQVVMLAITLIHELDLDFDIAKVAQMSFIHDVGEALIGDISETDIYYLEKTKNEKQAVLNLLSSLSEKTASYYLQLWLEIEERKTPLSIFINQVDKIDAILKAKYYDEEYGMPELYAEFYNHQLKKGVFTTGPLKEMFDSLKRKEE